MACPLPLGGVGGGKYDNAFMGILQDCVKLPVFLDAVFSFLARRTDFYVIMEAGDVNAKMGFIEGESESSVISAFKKYELLTRKREAEIMREKETKQLNTLSGATKQPKEQTKPSVPLEAIQDELPISLSPSDHSLESSSVVKETQVTKPKPTTEEAAKVPSAAAELISDTYNGSERENYKWSQSLTDLDIRVPVEMGTKSKDVRVDIRSDHLKVELLRPEKKVVLNDDLLYKVKVEDCVWTIDNAKRCLTINLEKTKEIMWKSVFANEEGIDLTKVDTTRDISEFDPETQAAIQRASYDNRMKMMGKPTSNEKKAHDILRKAWDAEGSPFKGTPFDPSRVQISGNW